MGTFSNTGGSLIDFFCMSTHLLLAESIVLLDVGHLVKQAYDEILVPLMQ